MLPPGISFNAISAKALTANTSARLPRSYWDRKDRLKRIGAVFPLHALRPTSTTACGSPSNAARGGASDVFRRHDRHAEATRAAVRAWGLEIVCQEPREYSSSLTAVFTPAGHDADRLRTIILENFDMSLGSGLSQLAGKVFRIGHLGR